MRKSGMQTILTVITNLELLVKHLKPALFELALLGVLILELARVFKGMLGAE